jgi:peptide/nickel transport system substrate-binding protein
LFAGLAMAVAACTPAPGPAAVRPSDTGATTAVPPRPKTLTLAIPSEPSGMSDKLFQAASDLDMLFQAGLMYLDEDDAPRPMLAARAPSQADGSWVVNADGTMRTRYTLKPDLKWQDGAPLTADDFVFAHAVYTDDEIPVSTRLPESLMTSVTAPDPLTVEITWRQPYVTAGSLHTRELSPMPRHLLAELFAQDRGAFMKSPFWTGPDYIGSGPYRLTDWDRGIGLTLEANPHFALGRPGVDTLRVLFIADANTVAARMLSSAVDVFPTATAQLALTLKERWQADNGGDVYITSLKARRLYFQFRDVPDHQKAVLDLRVRRALMHAIDRAAVATAVEGSLGHAADTAYPPGSRLYPRIEQVIGKYPYDVSRAHALLRDAGWTAGADGQLRDSGGRTLDVEIRTTEEQDATIIADYWKQAGINPTPVFITGVRRRDDEYRATFPATQLQSGSSGYLTILQTSSAPTAANGFRGSQNRGMYSNPEYDRRYRDQLTTLDPPARDQLLIELEQIITQDVAVGFIMYDSAPLVARAPVKGIRNVAKELGNALWNVWEWTLEEGR